MSEEQINDIAADLADTLAAGGVMQFSIGRNQIGLSISVVQSTTIRGVTGPSSKSWTVQPYNPPAPQQ
jgi:hypothetical protein